MTLRRRLAIWIMGSAMTLVLTYALDIRGVVPGFVAGFVCTMILLVWMDPR